MFTTPHNILTKKLGMNKFALGFAAVAASAIIGTTGLAAAQSLQQQQGSGYGNNENVTINLNLKNSTHNVINVVINFFR